GSIVLLSLSFGLYVINYNNNIATDIAKFDRLNDETIASGEVREHFLNIWQYLTDASLTQEEEAIKEAEENLQSCKVTLDEWIKLDPSKKSVLDKLKITLEEFYSIGYEMYKGYTISQSIGNEKMAIFDKMGKENSVTLNKLADEQIIASTSNMEEMTIASAEAKTVTRSMIIVIILVSIGITFVSIRNITKPLKNLTDATEKFGRGIMSSKAEIVTKDEFADLAVSFNKMVEDIRITMNEVHKKREESERANKEAQRAKESAEAQQKYLSESVDILLTNMNKFANGDLTLLLKSDKNDEIGKLFNGFNTAIASIKSLVYQVSESVQATASAASQISS
ncbi:MAG TPA: HAMP domain-containing protein, partial [Ignavibacteriaceae bacterium]|nr:HAMP domain-containing protein [Ignavibacteriaceae bacterium]